MATEPFQIDSYQQMVIHLKDDDSKCQVRKPEMICPCGAYQVRWLPVREPGPRMTMEAWLRGEDIEDTRPPEYR
jgi:hypothetical protein